MQQQGWYLENGMLTINAVCVYSIAEFSGYRWRESTDPNDKTRYRTATPVDNHADAMDARGQALIRVYVDEMRGPTPKAASVQWV